MCVCVINSYPVLVTSTIPQCGVSEIEDDVGMCVQFIKS
jgi:hypothetical protein